MKIFSSSSPMSFSCNILKEFVILTYCILISSFFLYRTYYLDYCARCRWSTNTGEPLLFVKYDLNKLNILDAEKETLVYKDSILTEKNSSNFNLSTVFLLFISFV